MYVYFAFITHDDRLKNNDVYYSAINLLADMGSCVVCEPLDRYVGRHLDRHIGRYGGRHIDRHIGRGVLVENRSICRPVCRPICRPMLDRYVGRYSGQHSPDTLTVEYRSSVGGLSVECRWSIGRLSYNIIDINSF